MKLYRETTSTCHSCGSEIKGNYLESDEGIWLETNCEKDGKKRELIERDAMFFKEGYEYQGYAIIPYLILPITYRCNLSCKFCYAHSNYKHPLPAERTIDQIIEIINRSGCQVVNLAGGEPTVREDLPQMLKAIKSQTQVERLCVVTNGQKTSNPTYLRLLKESGMDFIFLPLSIPGYDPKSAVIGRIIKSLDAAKQLGLPVWIQATIENLAQISPVLSVVEQYRRIIFNITIRSAKPYGLVNPENNVFISDIIRFLGKENDYVMGNHPFNRFVKLFGRKSKISSWVNDRSMHDPYDARYVIHDDTIIPFHEGMIKDDLFFKSLIRSS